MPGPRICPHCTTPFAGGDCPRCGRRPADHGPPDATPRDGTLSLAGGSTPPAVCPGCATPLPPTAAASVTCPGCRSTVATNRSVGPAPPTDSTRPPTVSLDRPPSATPAGSGTGTLTHSRSGGAAPTLDPLPPVAARVGRFEPRDKLGEGAFGEVYRAYDPQLDRDVALKVAKPEALATPDRVRRFLREAKAAAGLRHPNIVPLYEAGEGGGRHYIASAFVRGRTFRDEAEAAGGPLPPRRAAEVVRRLADALGYAHRQHIVHRDVKPANVIVDEAGEPHLLDFGLATRGDGDDRVTHDGAVMGTPAYMSPEQASGEVKDVGPASDQYALGVMLYESLTGRRPFTGTVEALLYHQVNTDPVRPRAVHRAVPPDLEGVTLKCLEKSPGRRYASCDLLAEDLRRWLAGEPVTARRLGVVERAARWVRRAPFQAATAAAAFGFLAVLVFALYGQARTARSEAELQRRELTERRRVEGVAARVADLYRRAEEAGREADALPDGDARADTARAAVERDAAAALGLIAAEPDLADHPLREPARRLHDAARDRLALARDRADARGRLPQLLARHADAVFFALDFTGLDAADNRDRTRRAAADGLALFGVAADAAGPPAADPRFFTAAETRLVTDRCYELLLLDAAAAARPAPGESEEAAPLRLKAAVARLDRADRLLGADGPARCGFEVRAEFLAALGDEAGAAAARESAAATPPRLAADHMAAALARYRRDDFAGAVDSLAALLKDHPDHAGAEHLLAVCRLRDKQYPAAFDGLTRSLERRPGFTWPRLLRGFAAMELGRWADARVDFDAVLAAPPDPTAAYVARVNRGVLAMRRRDWAAAEADLAAAAAANPKATAAHLNLALAARQRAEAPAWRAVAAGLAPGTLVGLAAAEADQWAARRRAVGVLDTAVRECPRDARLHHERGRLHLTLGDRPAARADFEKAVALAVNRGAAGTLPDDLIELGRLLTGDREFAAAVGAFRSAVQARPDRAVAWRLMAPPLLALGRYDEAGEALDRYVSAVSPAPGRPPTPDQAATLAEALRERGRAHEEEAAAFRGRALLQTRDRNLRAALDTYTRGLALARDPETLALRGWTYLAFDSAQLALADFDEAVRRRPGFADALAGRANARARLGSAEAAAADAEAAVGAAPPTPRLLYHAARAYARAAGWWFANRGDPDPGGKWVRRAGELLNQALNQTPAADRPAFWRDYVRADRGFDPVRNSPAVMDLDRRYYTPAPAGGP